MAVDLHDTEDKRLPEHYKSNDNSDGVKVHVNFRPVGSTRKLQNSSVLVKPTHVFASLTTFVRRQLGLKPEQSLFCYINSSFAPSLEAEVGSLYQLYGVEGVLNISYCETIAFG